MSGGLVTVSYIGAIILFVMTLGGLSHQETSRKGNLYGMIGMTIAVLATVFGPEVTTNIHLIVIAMLIGGSIGFTLAKKVEMTQMPELVAILHSLVGLAAVLVGYVNFMDESISFPTDIEKVIHEVEIYIGVLIGAVTFSGSVIAFGKLSGMIGGSPLLLPARHWFNLGLLILSIWVGYEFVHQAEAGNAMMYLMIMTGIALLFGIHMVMAIGGADMPVVISMLNSYSGWAAAGIGFTLENTALIITGALVGSSGAILSYIMCKGMNRSFFNVILGGFGATEQSTNTSSKEQKPVKSGNAEDAAFLMKNASSVIIVPGYGMAVAQAQHALREMVDTLKKNDIKVTYAIHPVAGRMPGHMNVLLAEANVPYDEVFELEEINNDFANADVAFVIGANDVTNPVAKTDPQSPIYGMPVLDVEKCKSVLFVKRSLSPGYAGIDNDLFYKENTLMLFADAKKMTENITKNL